MSDKHLRKLARKASQGDREAAELLLRARHRAGVIPAERLRALALLGEPVARRVLGGEEWPAPVTDPVELIARLRPAAHRSVVIRALLQAGKPAAAIWEEACGDGLGAGAWAALEAWRTAIEAGGDEATARDAARAAAAVLRTAAGSRVDAVADAGRALSGLAAVIDATGGGFLAQAEAFLERALAAGVSREALCEAILAAARAGLLEELE